MCSKIKISIYVFIFSILFIFNVANVYSKTIHITITNIDVFKGVIRIALYNNKKDFPKEGREYRVSTIKVNSEIVKCSIKDIPHGWYAIALYHDINNDNICNKNVFGIPVEPFGFSNNVIVKLKKPTFKECSFYVDRDIFLKIKLQLK